MIRYALTRLALLVLGLFVASALIFFTLRVLPGDVAQLIAGTNSTPEQVAGIRERLGLNEPLAAQYANWIGGILRGDLGTSLLTGSSVAGELWQKAQVTIPLGLLALTVALLIALPFGVLAAMRRGHADGTALSVGAQTIAAVPVVWAGMMLVLVFAVWLGWLPAQGFPRGGWADPGLALRSLLLPAITIGVIEGAMLLRFVRSATLQATGQDFVRTAAAKGLTRDQALIRHGLPTVGLSIITVLGLQVAGIIVGAVVIEQLFSLPGIGRMLVADVGNRDLPKVQGELLVLTGFVLVVGFVVDLVHRVMDPRQREAGVTRLAWLARLWALSTGRFGILVVVGIGLTALVARFWTPFDPQKVDIANRWDAPGIPHLLGTDGSGRDILSLLMAGARTTVWVALGAGVIATVIGLLLAALGALTARWVRESVAVLVDILIAFPVLLIAMMLSSVWGGSLWVVIVAVGIGFGTGVARVTRPELRRVLHSDFVLAGRASGLTPFQNLWRHLLPNVAPVFIVQLSWAMAVAVLAEAGLSYLGFGAPVTEPSWGLLLKDLQTHISAHPLTVVWPGLAITLTVLGFNLLGDGLRDATDPTLSRHRAARAAAETHQPVVVS